MNKKLTITGVTITLAYMLIVITWRWCDIRNAGSLPLNEFGDFLAGVVGPIAIFWLILGFLQQGEELRQNTAALRVQGDELKNSVTQHKELVETEKAVLELQQNKKEKERKPLFRLVSSGISSRNIHTKIGDFHVSFFNEGADAKDVTLDTIPSLPLKNPVHFDFFPNDEKRTIWWEMMEPEAPQKIAIILRATDIDGFGFIQSFEILLKADGRYSVNAKND